MTAASLSKPGIRCGWRLPLLSSHLAKKTVGCHCVLGGRSSQIIYIYIYIIHLISFCHILFIFLWPGEGFLIMIVRIFPLFISQASFHMRLASSWFLFQSSSPNWVSSILWTPYKGTRHVKIQGGESKVYKGHQWIKARKQQKQTYCCSHCGKLTWQWKIDPIEDACVFNCYVGFLEYNYA